MAISYGWTQAYVDTLTLPQIELWSYLAAKHHNDRAKLQAQHIASEVAQVMFGGK